MLPFEFPAFAGKKVEPIFDGGRLTSDGGPMHITHSLADMKGQGGRGRCVDSAFADRL
jgi:hypothetical protein